MHTVRVDGVPDWVAVERLLGPGWTPDGEAWTHTLPRDAAADVMARLRNLGVGGQALTVTCRPRLKRPAIRAGRTRDARLRRDTTPGFTRPGVRLDDEGKYSLTPESLALKMGRFAKGRHVTDLGCGAGGNTIGFARGGSEVVAVERHADRRADMLHNAAVYGVRERITAVENLSDSATGDLLFIDPPWGTDYDRIRTTVDGFPLLLDALSRLHSGAFQEMWAKLPPSFDPSTVPGAKPRAVFGERPGDRHRIKFVWLRLTGGE